jgi:hypothetical protein
MGMGNMKLGGMLLLCAMLLGCASQKRTQTFNEADLAPYAVEGINTLSGRISASYMNINGVIDANNTVCLTPNTPYTREWYQKEIIEGYHLGPPDPRLAKYQKTAPVDRYGDYRFEKLPEGDYFVTGSIRMSSPLDPNRLIVQDVHLETSLRPRRPVPAPQ